ncbi:hypothetical protein [Paenibacillus sp. S29]|uniref:hypothetical protein n=1 Tax=Paenibacillus sp. S29 TaxID=3394611 RepID=UPI0039BF6C5D
MLGVNNEELNFFSFKQINDRFPEHTGTFHGHMSAAMLLDLVDQIKQENRVGMKRLNRFPSGVTTHAVMDFL